MRPETNFVPPGEKNLFKLLFIAGGMTLNIALEGSRGETLH